MIQAKALYKRPKNQLNTALQCYLIGIIYLQSKAHELAVGASNIYFGPFQIMNVHSIVIVGGPHLELARIALECLVGLMQVNLLLQVNEAFGSSLPQSGSAIFFLGRRALDAEYRTWGIPNDWIQFGPEAAKRILRVSPAYN